MKEYKQQQAIQQINQQYPGGQPNQMQPKNALNANSRQQFVIEEEGAYS